MMMSTHITGKDTVATMEMTGKRDDARQLAVITSMDNALTMMIVHRIMRHTSQISHNTVEKEMKKWEDSYNLEQLSGIKCALGLSRKQVQGWLLKVEPWK